MKARGGIPGTHPPTHPQAHTHIDRDRDRHTHAHTHLQALAGGVDLDLDVAAVGGGSLVGVLTGIEASLGELIAVGARKLELLACERTGRKEGGRRRDGRVSA